MVSAFGGFRAIWTWGRESNPPCSYQVMSNRAASKAVENAASAACILRLRSRALTRRRCRSQSRLTS